MSLKRKKAIMTAYLSYMGKLMVDCMFCVPSVAHDDTYYKYICDKNIQYLDQALEKGKGVILPTLHTGQFFHTLGGIFIKNTTKDPSKKYDLVVVGGRDNAAMFAPITARYPNYHVLLTDKFAEVKDKLIAHLNQNHIVVIYYDFSSMKQLRTPFLGKSRAFLKATPQSVAALQRATGAAIVPAVSCPQGEIEKTCIEFLDPSSLNLITEQSNSMEKNLFHKQISIALNQLLHPYLLKYAHVWEELMAFGGYVYKNRLKLPANLTYFEFVVEIRDKIFYLLENSYEPSRNDMKLREIISKCFEKALNSLENPKSIFKAHKTYIKYFDKNGQQEIQKLVSVLIFQLNKGLETSSALILSELLKKLEEE
jgi:lauroyl/myristoyl acyltransferase